MQVVKTIREVRRAVAAARRRGLDVGLVPTMGAMHEGHLSLVRRARRETGYVVVSLFVNPTQFGPSEDFDQYPRPFERDCQLAEKEGVDLIFAPSSGEMYPAGFSTNVVQTDIAERWEGAFRPGHFGGVLTVVLKLFNIVGPDKAYFGQKDFQQSVVVRRMVQDFDMPTEIVVCPTVREPDGLAMSSRNAYLSPKERSQAVCLYEAMCAAQALFQSGETNADKLKAKMTELIQQQEDATIDYATIVDANTLQEVSHATAGNAAILAVRIGSTRLIDNMILS